MAVAAAGVLTALFLVAATYYAGPKAALLPLAAGLAIVLLRFPGFTFGLLLVGVGLAETEALGAVPAGDAFYSQVAGSLTLPDLLIVICLGGILLRCSAEGTRPRLPDPLTIPLLLLTAALAFGVVAGLGAQDPPSMGDLFHRITHVGYLIALPFLSVNVMRDTHALKLFIAAAAGLGAVKGITGLYASLSGAGGAVEDEIATFLSPFPNLLMLTFILGTAAALVRRVELPTWVYVTAPIATVALVLSYRRSFWIALAFTLIVVLIVASRRRGRAVLAVAALIAALTLAAGLTIGSSDDPSGSPLAQRAKTIAPSGIGSNRGDRYRLDERRNVIENIESSPVTGIGLGVNWSVNHPLAEDHDRRYAHVAVLWFWLAFGLLGVVAYLVLIGSGLWTAVQTWRRHADPLVQVAAIAAFGMILGLIVIELTATFTGFEPRVSLGIGAALGWLAAAWRDAPAPGKAS
jgi:O-antigen ligase